MAKFEAFQRQTGIGYLVLKSGTCEQVEWEIDLLSNGSVGDGRIRGDKKHLAAAAKDGCANLRLSPAKTAAIAIDRCKDGEASFEPLVISSAPPVFHAQTVVGSSAILDGSQFSIAFSSTEGEELLVIVPTIIMRDWLQVLQKVVPPSSSASATTSFIQPV